MNIEQLELKLSRRQHSPLFAHLADEYLRAGRIPEARNLCFAGLERYPSYATGNLILAQCFAAEGEYAAALSSLQHVFNQHPDFPQLKNFREEWQQRAEESFSASRTEIVSDQDAIEAGQEILQEKPPSEIDTLEPEVTTAETESVPTLEQEIPPEKLCSEVDSVMAESTTAPQDEVYTPENVPVPVMEEHRLQEDVHAEILPQVSEGVPLIEDTDEVRVEESTTDTLAIPFHQPAEIEASSTVSEKNPVQNFIKEEPIGEVQSPVELNEEGRIVSRTLAEIYAVQGAYGEAIITYRLLKRKNPELSGEFDGRIRELEVKLQAKLTQQ